MTMPMSILVISRVGLRIPASLQCFLVATDRSGYVIVTNTLHSNFYLVKRLHGHVWLKEVVGSREMA